jgi:hypothetical protein
LSPFFGAILRFWIAGNSGGLPGNVFAVAKADRTGFRDLAGKFGAFEAVTHTFLKSAAADLTIPV